jgi:hypothetical protein
MDWRLDSAGIDEIEHAAMWWFTNGIAGVARTDLSDSNDSLSDS